MSLGLLLIGLAMTSIDVTPANIAAPPAPTYVNVALLSDEEEDEDSDSADESGSTENDGEVSKAMEDAHARGCASDDEECKMEESDEEMIQDEESDDGPE